jgi:peptidyl-prolyl cis-trans isomerase SurA
MKKVRAAKPKNKPEKFRFGRAPAAPVSSEQIATSASPSQPTAPASVANSNPEPPTAPDVQPLGPDLEHTPLITQPKVGKWRFSDEARNKNEMVASKKHKKSPKVKHVKRDNAKATPESATEAENSQVQDSALGLNGSTAMKKKKRRQKVVVPAGEKIRMSDEKKEEKREEEKGSSTTSTSQTSSSGSAGESSSSTPPVASSSTDQPH